MAELKPCPFCGWPAKAGVMPFDGEDGGGHFVACTGCGASTNLRFACGDDPAALQAEAWNRRTDGVPAFDPTQPCDLQRLRDGWKPGFGGVPTMCMRCKNPHHACDGGGVAAAPALDDLPPVHIDVERMRKALAGPRIMIPQGLSAQEVIDFINAHADGVPGTQEPKEGDPWLKP